MTTQVGTPLVGAAAGETRRGACYTPVAMKDPPEMKVLRTTAVCVVVALLAGAATAAPMPSFFDEEVARFTRLAAVPSDELRIEAAQGFRYLGHHRGEGPMLALAGSGNAAVRLEAVKALGVCGRRRSIAVLIQRLEDGDWEVRQAAREALVRMTGAVGRPRSAGEWKRWLTGSDFAAKEAALRKQLDGTDAASGLAALRAMRYIGSSASEPAVLARLGKPPGLGREGVRLAILAMERIGTSKCLPLLIANAPHYGEAAWALAEIGGEGAEDALLEAAERMRWRPMDVMVNLDRMHSARCGPIVPALLQAFGLVIFRSQTDELHREPSAQQRVAANLILRTGQADQIVHLILAEAEGKRKDADTPQRLRALLAGMRKELRPGFVRSDGMTVAQPLAALPLIARNKRFVPRLIALLKHPAYLVRIYAAHTLGAMKAQEAVAPMLAVIRQPYGFSDATTLASGKHFGMSKSVRWRGYVCMALGKLGGEEARKALEGLATDPDSFRDIRYGSTVGLRFLKSPQSAGALERIAQQDLIRQVRVVAREAIDEIRLAEIERRQAHAPAVGK